MSVSFPFNPGFTAFALILSACGCKFTAVQCIIMTSLHFKLPPLKVTVRPTSGQIERIVIYREDSARKSALSQDRPEKDDFLPGSKDEEADSSRIDNIQYGSSDVEVDEAFVEGPSLHKIQKQAHAAIWDGIRNDILRAVVESEAMPQNQVCIKCNNVLATLRCRKCGPSAFSCDVCFLTDHKNTNLFHIAEEWKVIYMK